MTCSSTSTLASPTVLYDGACRFCVKSVGLLRKLDWFGRLRYADMRQVTIDLPSIPADEMLDQMHVLPGNAAPRHGFDAIRWLAWRLPALWPIAPLLCIPGVPQFGQRLYLWIARNRFRFGPCRHGICQLGPASAHSVKK